MRTSLLFLTGILLISLSACQSQKSASSPTAFSLEEMSERTFGYFWETADPVYHQIPDRYPSQPFSSIAATGFGLTSYIVGIENGYVSREEAADRVLNTLQALMELPQGSDSAGISGFRGFYYHFLTMDQALRFKDVELSTIDTGLLMAGVLSVQSYFDQENEQETSIRALSDSLFRRVEWDWAMQEDGYMSMGWRPERGFIPARWSGYNEAMILLIMAMGSPTHPIHDSAWTKWCDTYQWMDFHKPHLNFSPLFGHQYSHMYIDFRGIQDTYMRDKSSDYFVNSEVATMANRAYCIENPKGFNGYSEDIWGLTACDGPGYGTTRVINGEEVQFDGYRARGASGIHIVDDGTIAPTAAGGSLPFAPEESMHTLKFMWETYYEDLVGPYGFRDAFNLSFPTPWFDEEYLGIDQGPILIMTANYESGLIWDIMKKNPYIITGLQRAGFTGGWLEETP